MVGGHRLHPRDATVVDPGQRHRGDVTGDQVGHEGTGLFGAPRPLLLVHAVRFVRPFRHHANDHAPNGPIVRRTCGARRRFRPCARRVSEPGASRSGRRTDRARTAAAKTMFRQRSGQGGAVDAQAVDGHGADLPLVERLVDHHCHGVVRTGLDRRSFEALLAEGDGAGPLGGTIFDSRIGFALRRWCAPVLDLPALATPGDYLERRTDLGAGEVTRRFLRAAGLAALCVDTGLPGDLLSPDELAAHAGVGVRSYEIVRLEAVAEEVAAEGTTATGFAQAFQERLAERAIETVGFKSIAAYRAGLELSGDRPGAAAVTAAAGRWLSSGESGAAVSPPRLADETLHRFLVWSAVELGDGRPIQFHAGHGDRDVDLHRADPSLLTGLLRALAPTGTPVVLLHNYPFHRQAGHLAQVHPNVFADVGLALHNVGGRATAVLAELLELAPFGKVLFSSDAYALPDL